MAIITYSLAGLSVTIEVDGVTAKEFANPDGLEATPMTRYDFDLPEWVRKDPNPALPHTITYIEAKPGKPYKICITKEHPFRKETSHIATRECLDGGQAGRLRHEPYLLYPKWRHGMDDCNERVPQRQPN